MLKEQIEIGGLYDWGGSLVEAKGIEPDGKIFVEGEDFGEDVVGAEYLEPVVIVPFDAEYYRY